MSKVKADHLKNTTDNNLLINGYPRQPGRIIEYLSNQCDGSEVVGETGIYTWPNVTTHQLLTVTNTDVTGSIIEYTPPVGTRQVIYKYVSTMGWEHDHAITHWKLFIDNDEVLFARFSRSGRYPEDRVEFEWVINIGGTADLNTGRQSIWDIPKTLKMQARWYGTSNARNLHGTHYWDGAGGVHFSMPALTIITLA